MVKTPCFQCRVRGFQSLGQRTKIPYAMPLGTAKINKENIKKKKGKRIS